MTVGKIWAVFFSATGTTEKVVSHIAACMGKRLGVETETLDFTLPQSRTRPLSFSSDALVIFGTPVYAGRIPNVLLGFLDTMKGNGALAVAVAVFGNRAYDDCLREQYDLLLRKGFHPVAAGAFVGEHSFSDVLARARPDVADLIVAEDFSRKAAEKILGLKEKGALPEPMEIKGVPYPHAGYYQPRDIQGNPVDLRKVRPVTGDSCMDCKLCVAVCPMGAINGENVRLFTNICIKCGACIKKCPVRARYYDDAAYLYHKRELEEDFARRAEPELFV